MTPAMYDDADTHPPTTGHGGVRTAPLVVGALLAAGAMVWAARYLTRRQMQAIGAAAVLVWLAATPPVRWLLRRLGWGRRARLLAALWAGAVLAGWSVSYILALAVAVSPPLLWGAARGARAPVGQPIEAVKSDTGPEPSLEERWEAAARRTGLVVPTGPEAGTPLPMAGPVAGNGVGGAVLTVALPVGVTPADVSGRTRQLERWLHCRWVYARPAGGPEVMDLAEVHAYTQRPLAARPIPWQWLGERYVPGVHAVPYAADVFGDRLTLDMRKCTLLVGESRSGKTGVQLALIAGCALAGIPMRLHLADNRSGGDREFDALRSALGVHPGAHFYARSAPEVWAEVRALEVEIALRRDAGVSRNGAVYHPTVQWPLEHLAITELLALLTARTSRPPTTEEVADRWEMDWATYTNGRFESRPSGDDWMAMIADSLGGITREGASVGVSVSACTQGAQLDISPHLKLVRRHIPNNIAFRLRTEHDVDPALGGGALAAGADAHELPPDVPGLLYARPDGLTVVHGRGAYVPAAEAPDVAALILRAADTDLTWSTDRGGDPR